MMEVPIPLAFTQFLSRSCFGLLPNDAARAAYTPKQLRDKNWVKANGIGTSIMDGTLVNYVAQPGDGIAFEDLFGHVSHYDRHALEYAYRVFTPENEKAGVKKVLNRAKNNPNLAYIPKNKEINGVYLLSSDVVGAAELKLEETLHKRVVGQEEAVSAVARAVKRGRVGLKSPNRPIGSFLFLGPTGVGKTELSKALAEALFGREDSMIRVDMSEYMEKHSVAKMIGSPPGYVGHDEGGQLSDKVRTHPYSVILFDEIEKAHPDVFNILLQVLDDGRITDSQGRVVDFSNTVIIMTSNAGAKAIVDPKKLGFAVKEDKADDYKRMKQNVMDEVKMIFRPEFLNRIDEIIVFHALGEEHLKKIVSLMCREFTKRVKTQLDISLTLRDSAKKRIAEKGKDTKYGARPLRRAMQTELEDKLAEAILNGEVKPGEQIEAGVSGKEIKFYLKNAN